jgi:hypothetical protein
MSKIYLVLLACAVLAAPASAGLVSFSWTSEISNTIPPTPISGVSFGDEITVTVIADNGGTSLNSQQWFLDDLVSAHVSVGSYSATYTTAFIPVGAQPVFETNNLGELTSVLFTGTGPSAANVDNFGSGARLLNTSIQSSNGGTAFFVDRFVGPDPTDLVGWNRNPDVVPEPATLALLLSAGSLGLLKRRK